MDEIISRMDEGTVEGVDVIHLAQYVANFLSKYGKYGRGYDISQMEDIEPLPELHSEAAYYMLYDHGLVFAILKGSNNSKNIRTMGAYIKHRRLIWVDQRSLMNFGLMCSILAHEIQHAMDDIRSEGRALPPVPPNRDRAEYLARPQEINARFAQAMHDIVDLQAVYISQKGQPWEKQQSVGMIKKILIKHNLTRPVFAPGLKGNRAYNRILSRAYRFNDDVKDYIKPTDPTEKPSIIKRIKNLIRSYLPI